MSIKKNSYIGRIVRKRRGGDGGVCPLPWIRKIKVFSKAFHQSIFVFEITSLAAQGALAQRRPRPIHKNARFGAHPSSPPLGFNMAWGGRQKKSFKKTLEMSCNEFKKKSLTPSPLSGWSGGKINCVQEILEMSWNEKKLLGGGGSRNWFFYPLACFKQLSHKTLIH